MVEGFLLGVIATSSLIASLYFLKFWKRTSDSLFLMFSFAFFLEFGNRTALLLLDNPNEGNPSIYVIRAFGFLGLLGAMIRKNFLS